MFCPTKLTGARDEPQSRKGRKDLKEEVRLLVAS